MFHRPKEIRRAGNSVNVPECLFQESSDAARRLPDIAARRIPNESPALFNPSAGPVDDVNPASPTNTHNTTRVHRVLGKAVMQDGDHQPFPP